MPIIMKNRKSGMRKTILVIGGAGYIGSHTSWLLAQRHYNVIVLDFFIHQQNPLLSWATIIKGDFGDIQLLKKIFSEYTIDAVMHFAAFIEVGESVKNPAKYYHNNVVNTLQLLDVMCEYGVKKIIFSSSCAVYGDPVYLPLDEHHPTNPVSPYGKTKLIIEYALQDYAQAYGLQFIALRYFNAAGALVEAQLGEFHQPESHIIPILFSAALEQKPFYIFGTDYNTPDGTCIRDYIHVLDIADAHLKSYEYLEHTEASDIFNLGTSTGHSVQELVSLAQEVAQLPINVAYMPRRAGDAEVLVANSDKIFNLLAWQPVRTDMLSILQSAYDAMIYANKLSTKNKCIRENR